MHSLSTILRCSVKLEQAYNYLHWKHFPDVTELLMVIRSKYPTPFISEIDFSKSWQDVDVKQVLTKISGEL